MTGKDLLVAWLNDAHGMENALIQILEHQVKDAKDFPAAQEKIQQHLEQTRQHAEMVKSCVENLGGSTSSIKSGIASLFGQMQALSTGAAQDEMVKNSLADAAAEQFEIASYSALIAAAQELGEMNTVTACQQILQDEQNMLSWLQQTLPTLVQTTMNRMATPAGS
jgi:ferritin-like metal-binding protein YciE